MMLADLAVDHPYYCSDSHYYCGDIDETYATMSDFIADNKDCDIDLNLIFRWDVREVEEGANRYYAEVFIMQQRKGIFRPCRIDRFHEDEVEDFITMVTKHWQRLKEIWEPLQHE